MPTVISHAVLGLASAKVFYSIKEKVPLRFWFFSFILPIIPDADVIMFNFGIAYGDFFGHRGFFHSLFFAFILSLLVTTIFFRKERLVSQKGGAISRLLFPYNS